MAHDGAESNKIKKKGNPGNLGNQATKGIHWFFSCEVFPYTNYIFGRCIHFVTYWAAPRFIFCVKCLVVISIFRLRYWIGSALLPLSPGNKISAARYITIWFPFLFLWYKNNIFCSLILKTLSLLFKWPRKCSQPKLLLTTFSKK